ncbi:MAG: FmdB family zinc ribbon protein [Opitutales bacterium]
MPTYEYQCKSCGHELEAFQSISAAPLKKCPACGKMSLQRLISAGAGIIFKGGGFYETDYKRASSGKGGGESKDAQSGSESSSSDKSSSSKTQTASSKSSDRKQPSD